MAPKFQIKKANENQSMTRLCTCRIELMETQSIAKIE